MQSTMPLAKSSLEWNNHAVLLLEMGLREEAKILFQRALQTLGATLYQQQQQQEKDDGNKESVMVRSNKKSSPVAGAEAARAFTGWSRALLLPGDDCHSTTGVFVYNRALYIHPCFQNDLFGLYSAAIMFNLGLVHHMMALKSGNTSSTIEHYKQSHLFYEYAMKNITLMQQHQQPSRSTAAIKEQSMLKALLLNNSGHILYMDTSAESEAAMECFTAANSILINDGSATASLHDLDVGNLLRNILLFMPSVNAAASA